MKEKQEEATKVSSTSAEKSESVGVGEDFDGHQGVDELLQTQTASFTMLGTGRQRGGKAGMVG